MRWRYGNYQFSPNEATVVLDRVDTANDAGTVNSRTWSVLITGELRAVNQAALTNSIRNLEAAFSVNGLDFSLLDGNRRR